MARGDAARAKLGGGESRPHRSIDDLSAEEIERDTKSVRNVLRAWKRKGLRNVGISRIQLPSGRTLVYDWKKEEVVK